MPGAIIQLKNALQIDPNMLPVQLLLGKALMHNGEVAAAEVAFNEALRLGVNRAEVVVQLGQAYVAQGKHKLVLETEHVCACGSAARDSAASFICCAQRRMPIWATPAPRLKSIDEARAIDKRNVDVWLAEVPIRIRARQFKEADAAADTALDVGAGFGRGAVPERDRSPMCRATCALPWPLTTAPCRPTRRMSKRAWRALALPWTRAAMPTPPRTSLNCRAVAPERATCRLHEGAAGRTQWRQRRRRRPRSSR